MCHSLLILVNECFVETTSSNFGIVAYSKFLRDNGITNDGFWQREFLSYIPYGIHMIFIIFQFLHRFKTFSNSYF